MLSPYIPQADLHSAILLVDQVPWYLPKRYCAIVRGNRIFLRAEAQALSTSAWIAFLGHELTHVGQYRCGMTALKYLGCAVLGYRRNRYEKQAFAMQAKIARELGTP